MGTTEHTAKTPSTETGVFAALRGLLRVKGSGAPSRSLRASRTFVVLVSVLGALAFTAVPALAAAPETPETGEATGVTAITVTLKGVLNPKATGPGEAGFYEFRYKASERV